MLNNIQCPRFDTHTIEHIETATAASRDNVYTWRVTCVLHKISVYIGFVAHCSFGSSYICSLESSPNLYVFCQSLVHMVCEYVYIYQCRCIDSVVASLSLAALWRQDSIVFVMVYRICCVRVTLCGALWVALCVAWCIACYVLFRVLCVLCERGVLCVFVGVRLPR